MRPSFTHMRGIVFSLAILSILVPSCTQRQAAGDSYWAERADIASAALVKYFWNADKQYFNYDSASDTTFHYWPQAHALDVLTDGYLRSAGSDILNLYARWYEGVPAANGGRFWNPYYDDMEWNGIATLRVYKETGDSRFLEAARQLWQDIIPAWNDRGGGGMTWKKGMEWSKNACSNGPAAILAARLYGELKREEDLQWARRIYAWEKEHLFDNGAVYDNLNGDTGEIARFCLTYNQGTFIGAAVELYRLTGDRTYIDDAVLAADYTLDHLTVKGDILQSEGAGDGGIFKGIFVRYFTQLIREGNLPEATLARYVTFLRNNAETLWQQGNNGGRFGPDWREKPGDPSPMTPQLSGCMLLEAMALLEREGYLDHSGNPLFAGWYADPEGIVFDHTCWIYPTWSQPYGEQLFMDAFSSTDLVHWTRHRKVISQEDIPWLRQALWAPSVVEKDGTYYLFFGGNDMHEKGEGGIGVAVSDNPAGPFKDALGRPLIDEVVNGAQPIDQYVFLDDDGTYYMYYGGWRHCNMVKLGDDLMSLVPFEDGQVYKEITPEGYVEGPFMLKRDGIYYFMWSEGGWTGPDYHVAYAMADNPFGPFERIGTILESDPAVATGAGHHSVIKGTGKDEYYIIYHRHPLGARDGNNRVVCIERLYFDENGHILPVKISFEGVSAAKL